jgi:EAL domain-containing protein (putative c-di-GMP-specific phosphodiesterase class I)
VIAEQVEDQASFDALRELGVDFIQGYVVERPRPLSRYH